MANRGLARLVSIVIIVGLMLQTFALAGDVARAEASAPNLAQDPGFESGMLGEWIRPDWTTNGSIVDFGARTGTHSLFLNTWDGYVEQTVTGLKPNTIYTFQAWAKVSDDAQHVELGVNTYGGSELKEQVQSGEYAQGTVTFTTGATNTQATIFAYKPNNNVTAHVDDAELIEVGPASGGETGGENGGETGEETGGETGDGTGPDLVATDIAVDNPNFKAGDRVRFLITIKNQGDTAIDTSATWWGFEVHLSDASPSYLTWGAGGSIPAGGTITVTSEESEPLPSAELNVFARLDHGNLLPEADETNNESYSETIESAWYPEAPVGTEAYEWKQVAIGGGGAIPGVLFHPQVEDLAYIRTDVGGALRWDPANERWIQMFNWLPKAKGNLVGVQSLAVDPGDTTGNTLFAALGAFSHEQRGEVYKSVDRGDTWVRTGLQTYNASNSLQSYGEALAVDPNNGSVVYYASKEGLFRSLEAGNYGTWRAVDGAPTGDVQDPTSNPSGLVFIAIDPTSGTTEVDGVARTKTLYLGAYKDGIYQSKDGGVTWVKMPGAPVKFSRATVDQTGTLYITADYGNGGVFKFADDAWTDISPVKGKDYTGFSVDASNPLHLVTATHYTGFHNELFRSVDGGASWVKLDTSIQQSNVPWRPTEFFGACIFQVAIDPYNPKRVWFTDWYATWMTDDITAEKPVWYTKEYGHEEVVVSGAMTSPPSGDANLYTGFGDVGGFVHNDVDVFPERNYWDLGLEEQGLQHLNVNGVDFQETNPSFVAVVATGHWSDPGTGGYTDDGGETFHVFASKPYAGVKGGRVAVSATDETMVWVSMSPTAVPYYSNDRGATWHASSGAPAGAYTGDNIFGINQPLSSDRTSGDTFYLYKDGIIYISRDGGANWTASSASLPSKKVATVRAEPGKAGHVWVAIEGEGLYKSTNYGATFEKLLYIQSAALLAFGKEKDASSPSALYIHGTVSGREGVFRSDDEGKTWTKVSSMDRQLGTVPTLMAADRQVYGRVYVGTNGTGIHYGDPLAGSDAMPPKPPTQLFATSKTDDTVNLEWSNGSDNAGVAYYELYQDDTVVASVYDHKYAIGELEADTTYVFKLRSIDTSGLSSPFGPVLSVKTGPKDLTPPTVPSGFQSPFNTTSSVRLVWNASTDANGVKGYRIYMDGNTSEPAAFVTTTYTTMRGLAGSHTFTVTAVDAKNNESAHSVAVQADVTTATPGYVTGVDFIVTDARPETNEYTKGDTVKFLVTVKNIGDTDVQAGLPDKPIGVTIETAAIPEEGAEPDWTTATGTWGQYADLLKAGESITFLTNPWILWSADKHDYVLRAQVVWTEWAAEATMDNNSDQYTIHATPPVLPPVETATSIKASTAPVIDGNVQENTWKFDYKVEKAGAETPNNNASFATLWDDDYLYVAVKVLDESLKKDSTNLYEDDSVEIYIDGDGNKDIVYDAHDRQFTKRIDDETVGVGSMGSAEGVLHDVRTTEGGYTVEMAIPWTNLDIEPGKDVKLGFDVGVNDDDNGEGRDSAAFWSGNGNNWRNTSRFGDLTLALAPVDPGPDPGPGTDPDTSAPVVTNPDPSKPIVRDNAVILAVQAALNGRKADAVVTSGQALQAIDSAVSNKADKLVIQIPAIEGAESMAVSFPANLLSEAEQAELSAIELDTPFARISVRPDALAGQVSGSSNQVTFSVRPVASTELKEAAAALVGDYPVFDLQAFVDDKPVTQFAGHYPVTIAIPYEPQPGVDPSRLVVYHIRNDGTPAAIPNTVYDSATGTIYFTTQHFSLYALAAADVRFSDLGGHGWARDAINGLAARGIAHGIGAERFAPERAVTRAEFIQLLLRALELEGTEADASGSYSDVSEDAWYANAVAAANSIGIVEGYEDGTFRPGRTISRQEMAAMTERAIQAAGIKLLMTKERAEFPDEAGIGRFAKDAVHALQQAGVLQGVADGSFAPRKEATRAEAAVMLYKLLAAISR